MTEQSTAPRTQVYRGATRNDAERAYHADARTAADSGFVPSSEDWSVALGQHVITVGYVYAPDQVPAVLAALAGAAAEAGRAPRESAGPAVAAAPSAAAPATDHSATLAGVSWLGAAGATALLAFLQWDAAQQLGAAGVADPGFMGNAIWNGVAAVLTAFFGARCLRAPTRGFLGTSTAFGILNVAWGVYQVANGATHPLFYVVIIATGLAGVLSFAARSSAPSPAQWVDPLAAQR